MGVTTVVKTIGTTGTFSTPQLWESGAPADLTTSNNWTANTFTGTFVQGEVVTGTGITGGTLLDTDGSTYITFGTTTTPATGITVTGNGGATCVLTGSANTGVIWQGQCQNQEFAGVGTQITFSGSTSSSTAYKELTTVAGASFRNNVNVQTNALQYNSSNGCGIRNTTGDTSNTVNSAEANTRISNLQISNTSTNGRAFTATVGAGFFNNLIIEGLRSTGAVDGGICSLTVTQTIANSVIILRVSGAVQVIGTSTGSPSFYNCTIVVPDDLATAPTEILRSGVSGTVTVQNCGLFAGDSTKAIKAGSATYNFTTCYSDISGTTGVTQATYGSEFVDVNDATRDFRLVTGAAQKDTGTTDTTNAANDIAGTARPSGSAYDVGCWEFVQGGASSPSTAFDHNMLMM